MGNKISSDKAMQPHHDSKFRRIKIYIWLNEKILKPTLYYRKKSHKKIKYWKITMKLDFQI